MDDDSVTGSPTDFATFIKTEVERLATRRSDATEARNQADAEINEIDKEFRAVAAYQAAREGKSVRSGVTNSTSRRGSGMRRARQGSRREELIALINSHGDRGLKRGEILDALGCKGDKAAEMSVSNALTALIKNRQLSRKDGNVYIAAAPEAVPAAQAA